MRYFETIKLRAPDRVLIPARQSLATHDTVDAFECVVRVASTDEMVPVATFRPVISNAVSRGGACDNWAVWKTRRPL